MVYPDSTEDVVKIVNVARKHRMPIIPYSGGTSVEGHFAGVRGPPPLYSTIPIFAQHIALSASIAEGWGHMCRHVGHGQNYCNPWCVRSPICVSTLPTHLVNIRFSEEDSDLVCQPGVGWMEINETLKEKGIPLFFPVRVPNPEPEFSPPSSFTHVHSSIPVLRRLLVACLALVAPEVSVFRSRQSSNLD